MTSVIGGMLFYSDDARRRYNEWLESEHAKTERIAFRQASIDLAKLRLKWLSNRAWRTPANKFVPNLG